MAVPGPKQDESCHKGKSEQPVLESVEGAFLSGFFPMYMHGNLSMEDAKYLVNF